MNITDNNIHEYAVLGCIIKDNTLIKDTPLREEYFTGNTRNLFKAMLELENDNKVIDIVSLLSKQLERNYGGVATITECNNRSNVLKFNDYVSILIEKWQEREKLNILAIAAQENWSLDMITNKLNELVNNNVDDHYELNDLLQNIYEMPFKKQQKKKGVTTGFRTLDIMTGGLQNGALYTFGARPGLGKTDFILNMSIAIGMSGAKPVIHSMEMVAKGELDMRLIANVGGYNRTKMQNPEQYFTEAEKERWPTVLGETAKVNASIFDRSKQSVKEVYAKTRKIIKENPDKQVVVLIDYLTLMKPGEPFKTIDHQSVSAMTKDLKIMAKELDVPVVVLAQLSRQIEQRQDKRPQLSDLRESGAIEEDSNVVGFLYRDGYYTKDEKDNSFEILLAKNRGGAIGMVQCVYNKNTGKIIEIAR